jgi:hypothetical protein
MRRWLFLVLLCVMPFQLVWASVAPYCAHETGSAARKHFGHHEHQHQAGGELTMGLDIQEDGSAAYHADCESCHLGCSVTLTTPAIAITASPHDALLGSHGPRYTSHVPSGPERPDRIELTPAARFGGVVEFRLLLS